MKKLLIFMLVLGMASSASALPGISGPSTINIAGGNITLTLSGTSAEASNDGGGAPYGGYAGWIWVEYGLYPTVTNQLSNVSSATTAMGAFAAFDLTTYLPSGGGFKFTAAPDPSGWTEPTDVDTGAWFTFEVSLDSTPLLGETYNVQILDTQFVIIDAGTFPVTVVPEPTTVALLGLGGLFLMRRRKK